MLRDASDIPAGSVIRTDVCLVGAGAAGITLARALRGRGLDVVVLESGGLEEEPDAQTLNHGDAVGRPYYPLDETRYRRLGGTTHRWAGWCRPLDPVDFEPRSGVPDMGWPLAYDELSPYYRPAAEVCRVAPDRFDPGSWGDAVPAPYRPPIVGGDIRTVVWQGSPPVKFGEAYREELEAAQDVTVYLHATVLKLTVTSDGSRVTAAQVARGDGGRFEVAAGRYVLAAGALETARLLLLSRGGHPDGVGNQHGNVGRYFADHPHGVVGVMRIADAAPGRRSPIAALDAGGWRGARARLQLRRPVHGIKVGYALHERALREHGLLNLALHLVPEPREGGPDGAYWSLALLLSNARSPRRLLAQIRQGAVPDGFGEHLREIARHPAGLAGTVYREVMRRPVVLGLYAQAEQAPNRESRVTLSDRRDRFGAHRLQLDWRLADVDRESMLHSVELIGAKLERAGIGRVEPVPWLRSDGPPPARRLDGGHHQLGTARMSADPRRGVVDRHGRVHGVANLYAADGSVFPSIGFANPLLTIVALALRTADHLAASARP